MLEDGSELPVEFLFILISVFRLAATSASLVLKFSSLNTVVRVRVPFLIFLRDTVSEFSFIFSAQLFSTPLFHFVGHLSNLFYLLVVVQGRGAVPQL